MRLLLQQRPDAREAPRFVQLTLQPDLLGGWTLLRETGQTGGRSTLRREQFLDHASALAALAMVTTVVPGTVWCELAPDNSAVTLHVWDLVSEASFIHHYKSRYEAPLLEIFR